MEYSQLALFGLAVVVGLGALLLGTHIRSYHRYQSRLSEGLSQIGRLRKLLTLIQQHRGLTSGYLCGDKSLGVQIQAIQREVSEACFSLWVGSEWSVGISDWQPLEKTWRSLSADFEKLESSISFQMHSSLITRLLYLIDDCGQYYSLYEIKDLHNRSIRYLWQDLLVTSEYIGQARAIGTGVAASGECNSVDRIRLNYLQQAIGTMRQNTSNTCPVSRLIEIIQTKIAVEQPKISATEYFQQATAAMEETLKAFDETLLSISKKRN